ncbi:MAG: arylamine N-acetyltransferase [Kovacikia sp.]
MDEVGKICPQIFGLLEPIALILVMQEKQTPDSIDLDAYFQRIGYRGDRTPTLKTLQAIHLHHTKTIPFENLSSFLKQPVYSGLFHSKFWHFMHLRE